MRKIAEDLGLVTAKKKTLPAFASLANVNSASSWAVISQAQPGKIITVDGDEIGEHQG